MPVEYAFFDDPALICIRQFGHITADILMEAAQRFSHEIAAYSGHPNFVDLSGVTGHTIDHTKFMSFMAFLAEIYSPRRDEQLIVVYAPLGAPAELAELIRRPWEGNSQIIVRVAETQSNAFDILGGARQGLRDHLNSFST